MHLEIEQNLWIKNEGVDLNSKCSCRRCNIFQWTDDYVADKKCSLFFILILLKHSFLLQENTFFLIITQSHMNTHHSYHSFCWIQIWCFFFSGDFPTYRVLHLLCFQGAISWLSIFFIIIFFLQSCMQLMLLLNEHFYNGARLRPMLLFGKLALGTKKWCSGQKGYIKSNQRATLKFILISSGKTVMLINKQISEFNVKMCYS